MKTLIKAMALLSMLSLFSCSKTIHTQEEVLNSYQTSKDITKKFGIPTERKTGETMDSWLYKYNGRSSAQQEANVTTASVAEFGQYKRYVLFILDKQGNVLRWDYRGVDLVERKKAPGRTVLLVGGLVVGIAAVTIIAGSLIEYDLVDSWGKASN